MKKIYVFILLIFSFSIFMAVSALASSLKYGPEYSLMMDVDSLGSSIKNIILETPNMKPKTLDNNYKMMLINGNLITDVEIVTKNNLTLVPIRAISENINAKITWDGTNRKVTINKSNINIELTINKKEAYVNSKKVTLDVVPEIIDNYTYLPLRFVSENMGCKVDYIDTKKGGFDYYIVNKSPFFFPTIIVEENTQDKAISTSEALNKLKTKLKSSLLDYEKMLLTVYDKDSVSDYISRLQGYIEKISLDSNIGRFYYFSSEAGNYLVDMYCGDMFIFRTSMNTRVIDSFEKISPALFNGLAG